MTNGKPPALIGELVAKPPKRVGRKLIFQTAEELAERIEAYFDSLWDTQTETRRAADGSTTTVSRPFMRPPTMAGLALHLGVERKTIWNYGEREDFTPVIRAAVERIAEYAETALYDREKVTGARFALEVNHRYGKEREDLGDGDPTVQALDVTPPDPEGSRAVVRWEEAQGPRRG